MFRVFFSTEEGNVGILFGMLLLPIAVLIGGAIDFSRANNYKLKAQYSLDQAVLHGAMQESDERHKAASDHFNLQTAAMKDELGTPQFHNHSNDEFYGQVQVNVKTSFLSLMNLNEITLNVDSKVKISQEMGSPCVLLLDPNAENAVQMISSSNVRASECEIHVHSSDGQAGKFSSLSSTSFKKVCIKGGASGSVSNLETNCMPAENSLAGTLPTPVVGSCTYSNTTIKKETLTIANGTVFCGDVHLQEVKYLTFEPGGLFIVKNGRLKLSAKNINGDGVTFYFAENGARLEMDSEDGGELSAPDSGPYKDILMFMPDGLDQATTKIISTNFQNWEGIVYVPSWNIELVSPSSWEWEVNLIANTLNTDSVSNWELEPFESNLISGSSSGRVLSISQ